MIEIILILALIIFLASIFIYFFMKKKYLKKRNAKMLLAIKNEKNIKKKNDYSMKDHLALALLDRDKLLNKNGGISASEDTNCYGINGKKIMGCKCHPTCGSCGYARNPVGMNQCLSCKNGSDVNILYSNGAGWCSLENNSENSMIRQQTGQTSNCNRKIISLCGQKNKHNSNGAYATWKDCLKENEQKLLIAGCKFNKNYNISAAERYKCDPCIKLYNPRNRNSNIGTQKCCSEGKYCYTRYCNISENNNIRVSEEPCLDNCTSNDGITNNGFKDCKSIKVAINKDGCAESCTTSKKKSFIEKSINDPNLKCSYQYDWGAIKFTRNYHERYSFSKINVKEEIDKSDPKIRTLEFSLKVNKEIPKNSIVKISNLKGFSTQIKEISNSNNNIEYDNWNSRQETLTLKFKKSVDKNTLIKFEFEFKLRYKRINGHGVVLKARMVSGDGNWQIPITSIKTPGNDNNKVLGTTPQGYGEKAAAESGGAEMAAAEKAAAEMAAAAKAAADDDAATAKCTTDYNKCVQSYNTANMLSSQDDQIRKNGPN